MKNNLSTLILGIVLGGLLMSVLIPRDVALDARLFSPETRADVGGDGVAIAVHGSQNHVAAAWQPAPTPQPEAARFSNVDTVAIVLFFLISSGAVAGTLLFISRGGGL